MFFVGFIKSEEEKKNVEEFGSLCVSVDTFIIPDDVSKAWLYLSLFQNLFSPLPYVIKYYRKEMQQRIEEIIDKNKIDLVHFGILQVPKYKKVIKGIPTCLTEHNVESLRVKRLAINSKNIF